MSDSESLTDGYISDISSEEEVEELIDGVVEASLVKPYQNEPLQKDFPGLSSPSPNDDEKTTERIGNCNWYV